jgi:hypothetical protein
MGIRTWTLAAVTAGLVAGCAAGPVDPDGPIVERVDERTAVNVVTLDRPLLFSVARGAPGQALDLALGPVEINRQGDRTWYLWGALLGADLGAGEPRLRVLAGDEVLVDLAPVPPGRTLPVSARPYAKPADWATERYWPIEAAELARLQGRTGLRVELASPGGTPIAFEPWDAELAALDAYVASQVRTRLATR